MNLLFANIQSTIPVDKLNRRLFKLKNYFQKVNNLFNTFGFKFSVNIRVHLLPDRLQETTLQVDMRQPSESLHISNLSESRIDLRKQSNSHLSNFELNRALIPNQEDLPADTFSKFTIHTKAADVEILEVSLFDLLELKKQKVCQLLIQLLKNDHTIKNVCFILKVDRVQRRDRMSYLLNNDMHFMSQFSTLDGEKYIIKNEERFDLFFEIDMLSKKKIPKQKRREALDKYKRLKVISKQVSKSTWDSFVRWVRGLQHKVVLQLWKFQVFHDNSNYFRINKLLVFIIVIGYLILIEMFWVIKPDHQLMFFIDYVFLPFIDFFNIFLYFAFFFSNKLKIKRIFIFCCFLSAIKGFVMTLLYSIGLDNNKLILFSIIEIFVNLGLAYIQCFNYSYHYFVKYVNQIKYIQ